MHHLTKKKPYEFCTALAAIHSHLAMFNVFAFENPDSGYVQMARLCMGKAVVLVACSSEPVSPYVSNIHSFLGKAVNR
jgi:glycerol uptake facilitator-like aquaporin